MNKILRGTAILLAAVWLAPAHAVEFVIVNNDGTAEGLNDPTPRAPTGGNVGTTLGEQRLIALEFIGDLLGDKLNSAVPIRVNVRFDPDINCTPTMGTLAAAGPTTLGMFRSQDGQPPRGAIADTLYPVALANALAGRDGDPRADVNVEVNSSVDNNPGCLGTTNWYYGLDNDPPGNDIDFLSTATHEILHGLGFITFVEVERATLGLARGDCGNFLNGIQDIFGFYIRHLPPGPNQRWPQLTAGQRCDSITDDGNLVWDGPSTNSAGAPTLQNGTNAGRVQLYAPSPVEPGSSVSHWDTVLSPNDLMEPFETGDIAVLQGIGLSSCLLQDIGWNIGNTPCPDNSSTPPAPPTEVPPTDNPPDNGDGDGGGAVPTDGGSSGGGGGGCVLASGAPDPLFPLMLLLALGMMARKRRV